MIRGIWALFSLLFIFLWNRKPWLDNFMFIITLECSKLWIWMEIYFRDILLIRISRGTNNCVQRVFEKNIYFIMIFSPIFNCFSSMKGYIFVIILNKRSKGFIMQVYIQSLLWSYLTNISDHDCIYCVCYHHFLTLHTHLQVWVLLQMSYSSL